MKITRTIVTTKATPVWRIQTRDPANWHLIANRNIAAGEQLTTPGVSSLFDVAGAETVRVILEETQEAKTIFTRLSAVPGNESCALDTLEMPWCFMNHSCAPNTCDRWPNETVPELRSAETFALRDIAEGEELTFDYCTEYYDYSPPFACWCGADTCRGTICGFNGLSRMEREEILPHTSPFIQAKYRQTIEGIANV